MKCLRPCKFSIMGDVLLVVAAAAARGAADKRRSCFVSSQASLYVASIISLIKRSLVRCC